MLPGLLQRLSLGLLRDVVLTFVFFVSDYIIRHKKTPVKGSCDTFSTGTVSDLFDIFGRFSVLVDSSFLNLLCLVVHLHQS